MTLPLAAANALNQSARTVMAIVGPVLAVELGLSASEPGVLAACLFAAYAAAQLSLGVALDAFGARRVQAVLMVFAAIGFAMFALSPGFAGLAAARIVLGIGVSGGLMAVIKAHADWFERGRVAFVTGIATAIGALGTALTTSPPARAGVLFLYTFAMATCLPAAPPAGRMRSACRLFSFRSCRLPAWCCCRPASCCSRVNPWSCSCFGWRSRCSVRPDQWATLRYARCFLPSRPGGSSTAANTLTLGAAFLVQAGIGWILDLWSRTASGGWDPDGYSWALALTAAFQALAALVMATAQRRRHAISV
ncbi:MAG: MFS transporter [Alphaproteobacteria bacterium]|nr:MFS transporter [Alphaproteobacteria bacterium]MBV8409354.1 MFS transporter [Alphaproteobacteria bacterium]